MIKKPFIIFTLSFLAFSAMGEEDQTPGQLNPAAPEPTAVAATAAIPANPAKQKVQVPTLSHWIRYGDIINEDDIVMKEFPAARINGGIINSASELFGKTPKNSVGPNQPIRKEDITTRRLVEKGALVTMVYKTKNMEISTTGQALDQGSMGDGIRIKNNKSGLVVSGTVAGNNLVKVMGLVD